MGAIITLKEDSMSKRAYYNNYNKNQKYNSNRRQQNTSGTNASQNSTSNFNNKSNPERNYNNIRNNQNKPGNYNRASNYFDTYAEEERRYLETKLIREGLDEATKLLSAILKSKNQVSDSHTVENTQQYKERVAIFVDGSNIRYAISSLSNLYNSTSAMQFDARKLCEYIEKNIGHITDAYYYDAADRADGTDLNFTQNNGFAQILKQVKVIQTGEGKQSKKCNLDVEIVLDMMATINHYDICVLLSGDSDFKRPLEVLKSMGKKFVVISTRSSISRELLHLAGRHLLLIDDHQEWFTGSTFAK